LAYYGIDREHAAHYVELALPGVVASQVFHGPRRFDLLVRLDEPFRNVAALRRLPINVPGTPRLLQFGQIADVADDGPSGYSPNIIHRENARRRLVVRCNVQGRDLGSVADDIQRGIRQRVPLPPGYYVELGGQLESQRHAGRMILILGAVAV